MKEVLHPESQSPNGVRVHLIDVYLDELAKVGGKEVSGRGGATRGGAGPQLAFTGVRSSSGALGAGVEGGLLLAIAEHALGRPVFDTILARPRMSSAANGHGHGFVP